MFHDVSQVLTWENNLATSVARPLPPEAVPQPCAVIQPSIGTRGEFRGDGDDNGCLLMGFHGLQPASIGI